MDTNSPIPQIFEANHAVERINGNFDAASPSMLFGRNSLTCIDLTFGWIGGRHFSVRYENGTVAVPANSTRYLVKRKDDNGDPALFSGTSQWNNTTDYYRLFKLVSGPTSISNVEDHRDGWLTGGGGSGTGSGGTSSGGGPSPSLSWTVATIDATTARNLEDDDKGRYLRFTNASAKTLTVRPDSTEALTDNAEYSGRNVGAGDLTIVEGAGVTINEPAGGSLVIPEGGTFTLKRVDVDEFDLFGITS